MIYYIEQIIKRNLSKRELERIIKNNNNYEEISEKILQQMILEDIPSFLSELGEGFTFIKNDNQNKTIGIIIVRRDNKNIIEYSSDDRIISREYQVI